MKFRRRKKNILPRGLLTIGAAAGHANEIATRDAALTHAGKSDISDMKLEHWLGYAKSLDATKDISDVFTQDENEYEASTASEAFTELGTTAIASSQHVAIATTAPPQYPLDVEGDINFSGNLRKNGELFGWTGESSNLFYVNGNVGVCTSLPQGTMHISSGGTGDCKLILEADTDNNGAGSGSGGSNTYTVNFITGSAIPSTSKAGGWHTYTYGDFVLPTDFTKSNLSISVTWNGTMPIRFALGQYVGFHLNKLDSNGNEHNPGINVNFAFDEPGQGISGSWSGPTIYNNAIRTSSSINNGRWVGGDTIRASMGIFRHYFSAGHTCSIAITYDRTSSSDENDNPMILFRQDGGVYKSSVRMSDNRLEFVNSASTSNGFAFYLGNQESSTGTSGLDAAEEKVTIDSAGNLGIGQTTPTQKLDVAGTVKAIAFEGDGSALTGISASGGGETVVEVNINAPNATSGSWTTDSTSGTANWGPPKFHSTYTQYAYTDGTTAYRQWNIPTNMKSAYVSQLQWDSGGYADIHGVRSDGNLVFLRRINTFQNIENSSHSGDHDGSTITFIGSGLQYFTAIRISNRLGRIHLSGLAFTDKNNDGAEGTGMVHSKQISDFGTHRPLWRASYTNTNGYRNTGTVPFNQAEINQRSGYSTSTGLFTAPVAGHYWVYGQMYSHPATGKNEICFIINGSTSITKTGMAYGVSGDTIPHFVNMVLMTTVWLNVNDTIGVYVRDAQAHYNGTGVAYFGGHLLA